jgi:hypothetical protein
MEGLWAAVRRRRSSNLGVLPTEAPSAPSVHPPRTHATAPRSRGPRARTLHATLLPSTPHRSPGYPLSLPSLTPFPTSTRLYFLPSRLNLPSEPPQSILLHPPYTYTPPSSLSLVRWCCSHLGARGPLVQQNLRACKGRRRRSISRAREIGGPGRLASTSLA